MSNGWRWELAEWGDSTTRLAFWDSIAGRDVFLILNEDGTADRAFDDADGNEQRERVNAVAFLRQWLASQS